MDKSGLPPLVGEIANGSVTWQRLEGLDYEFLGYFFPAISSSNITLTNT
jgi:hypothetical protein